MVSVVPLRSTGTRRSISTELTQSPRRGSNLREFRKKFRDPVGLGMSPFRKTCPIRKQSGVIEGIVSESGEFSHFDASGASRMVDVGGKQPTVRRARAVGFVTMQPETLRKILDRGFSKGDVFEVARLAGIMAAKRTSELIPLCHPLPLESIRIDLEPADDRTVRIEAVVGITGRTGVEMEALTAVDLAH